MPRMDHDVIHKSCILQRADTAIEGVIQNELVIRLVLDEVTQPLQLSVPLQIRQNVLKFRGGDGRPANHSLHPSGISGFCLGQTQEPSGFLQGLARLHRNRTRNAGTVKKRLQIAGKEITTQKLHLIVDPSIFGWTVTPEMMMSINTMSNVHGYACPEKVRYLLKPIPLYRVNPRS